MSGIAIEAAGWIGAICVFAAYVALSTGRLTGKSALFHWLNMVGAVGFVINTWAHRAIPSMVLNIVWAGVGAYALLRIMRHNQP
ncbi:hypothetical protein OOT33_15390 [Sphingobium sp. DEHP117]|uniref:CBU_0592 family membrane protein n=1 Tax=Sphingobium sp. DEHP117 TaxID=2993436 RepID=UPI0027D5A4C1|nr:hypothetical protein [Sphingobium sp. DEHP117]MDQ4421806.1 hypothetical protein [Sphingobium sp. DEHP117]